jgi:hypothetical protein
LAAVTATTRRGGTKGVLSAASSATFMLAARPWPDGTSIDIFKPSADTLGFNAAIAAEWRATATASVACQFTNGLLTVSNLPLETRSTTVSALSAVRSSTSPFLTLAAALNSATIVLSSGFTSVTREARGRLPMASTVSSTTTSPRLAASVSSTPDAFSTRTIERARGRSRATASPF